MASPGRYQSCVTRTNLRAASVRLVLAIILGLASIVATRTAHAQTYTVIHNFTGGADGEEPNYGLTIDASGNLYGTTFGGDSGQGTAFMLSPGNPAWTLTPLYAFSGLTDGAAPYAAVVFGPDGTLYGTTGFGGVPNAACTTGGSFSGCGTVFNMKNPALREEGKPSGFWTETVLYEFLGLSDGAIPYGARVIFDRVGNLYGTAFSGGGGNCQGGMGYPSGCGVIYELTPSNGGWTQTVLYTFSGGNDGAHPWAGVIFDQSGNLYGTTEFGGAYGYGTVYELTPAASGWTLKTLYSFQNTKDSQDGGQPFAGLIFDSSGNLYGATTTGGAGGGGTVFELTPSGAGWTFQTLYGFASVPGHLAQGPTASLVFDNGGNLYGATAGDGLYSFGSVFKLTRSSNGTWTYTSLYDFQNLDDGRTPRSNLVFDKYGNLYGTATGGQNGYGLVFEITFPMQYMPLPTPCRVVDTRNPNGPFGGPPIQGGTQRGFSIPSGPCNNIPSYAASYALNVTVVPEGPLGYLTIWPTGQPQPVVSTLNSDGRVKANAAIVPAGNDGGAVSVFATDTTNVLLDIAGYFAPVTSSTLAFYPVTPCRIADTRNGKFLQAGKEADFTVVSTSCNIPSSAQAFSLNITAIPKGPLQYLTVWPTGQTQPVVSTLNAPTGTVTANAAIVGAGANGQVAVFPTDDTNLLIDIDGYFAAPGSSPTPLSLYAAASPCRVLDTRPPMGNGPFNGTLAPPVDVWSSPCNVPTSALAYVFNATVVPPGPMGYLTLWPDGGDQPNVSTLNAYDGALTSNMAIVPADITNGKVDAYASGLTNLILDISSYFAP
jgi:uncharacterized repeat protein (TIGR03803 family)